jgi:hypothetical protein
VAFLSGIVEGFYGREWSWAARLSYAEFLQQTGLNSYIYCPKADAFLRKQWWQTWPKATETQLRAQALAYRQRGLNWGVGLSPYALYQDYSGAARTRLREKLKRIEDLGGNLLAILFDDMPGDCPDLAARQCEILADVQHWSRCEHRLVCPTYYSFDPQLQRYFGPMPEDYWPDLGRGLAAEWQIMWTGNEVCSASINAADISTIRELVGRRPVLWDNYPVNDGEKASNFLNLAPLHGRDADLARQINGHFCNPMNQAQLSRYPLTGLARLYGDASARADAYFSARFWRQLQDDQPRFEELGLQGMTAPERERLALIYQDIASDCGDAAALEIADWLQGGYRFDPACLTG